MKRVQCLARINKDPDSDWGASVPDLPGCVATGETIDAALRRIEEAIPLPPAPFGVS
jgi:predicted RNase H-like HicB family nuclease